MNSDLRRLAHGYFDDSLTADECEILFDALRKEPEAARQFAELALVHDQLRNALAPAAQLDVLIASPPSRSVRWRTLITLATTCAVLVIGLILWQTFAVHPAAAATELQRIIAASSQTADRTYLISVEEAVTNNRPKHLPDFGRPPKPSIDGARLYVRGSNQFVLQRKLDNNQLFITGCNGKTSWAVRPDGPVRVSSDLTEFNRDVPGHEHAMPLNNLHDGLETLQSAYDVQVMPVEEGDTSGDAALEPSRLLVAVKKSGFRGPKRVEITYAAKSGEIRQMRFVDMPYGPDRLTLRMTLLDAGAMDASFFDHQSHHDQNRNVEFEK